MTQGSTETRPLTQTGRAAGTFEIASLHVRTVLNSHAQFTKEFIVELQDGSRGVGSSSKGETISIYEDRTGPADARTVIDAVEATDICRRPIDQETFDEFLTDNMKRFGRNNCFALSLAFHNAACAGIDDSRPGVVPRLCLNILNGGWHAYTNPVLCDFSEIMLVPEPNDLAGTLKEHHEIQRRVREKLLHCEKTVINGNPVNVFKTRDNRAPIELLLEVLREAGLADQYDLMIDASAGDLRTPDGYRFSLTDDSVRTTDQLCEYWLQLSTDYPLRFLEDPFQETDFAGWQAVTAAKPPACSIIGDNLYSSDATRIRAGASAGYSNGVIIKPNQAGTVTATLEAVRTARAYDQTIITSHRSISTESTYICSVTNQYAVPYIKIGPLFTDYSSVLRLNELIRLAGVYYA